METKYSKVKNDWCSNNLMKSNNRPLWQIGTFKANSPLNIRLVICKLGNTDLVKKLSTNNTGEQVNEFRSASLLT